MSLSPSGTSPLNPLRALLPTRNLEARSQHLLEQMPGAALIVVPRTGQFLALNGRATALTGWTREELLARSLAEVFPASEALSHFYSLEPGNTKSLSEIAIRTRFGQLLAVDARLSALREGHETVVLILASPSEERLLLERERARLAHMLAGRLRARRMRRGALDIVSEEPVFALHGDRVADVRMERQTAAHSLVEECMIAANEAVARLLIRKGAHTLFRTHEHPDQARIERLYAQLEALGVATPPLPEGVLTGDQRREAARVASHAVRRHVERTGRGVRSLPTMVLRALRQAVYTPDDPVHSGLASVAYLHFTSPIRRYPDLHNHRRVREWLERRPDGGWDPDAMAALSDECTAREQDADAIAALRARVERLEAEVAALRARAAVAAVAAPLPPASVPREAMQALAYAPASTHERAPVVTASAPIPRSIRPSSLTRPAAVTINSVVGKGVQGQRGAVMSSARLAAANKDNDLWTRAMILAPSAASMTLAVMGEGDVTVLSAFFHKPTSAIAMGFAEEAHPGLAFDRFSGPAVGALALTSFVTKTASLR